ncbi:MAG: ligase-associated DNA damage response endonuclease PdeM [Methyloligellaceae bacterium]
MTLSQSSEAEYKTLPEAALHLGSREFIPDHSGALYWREEETLIFSDLHLEKGSSLARRSSLLPPFDSDHSLERLKTAIARYSPHCVILLGDSFHDIQGLRTISEANRRTLNLLQQGRDWIWINGNHDPEIPAEFGGEVHGQLTLGNIDFRHEPQQVIERFEVSGHLHPVAIVARKGRRLRRRCFIANNQRIVMPAFGAYTGGLSIQDSAFQPYFANAEVEIRILGRDQVYPVRSRDLAAENL